MICFNCGYKQNDPEAVQCKVCGVKFEHKCSSCGESNPKHAKFCLHCGHDLKTHAEEAPNLEETRKQVAVLFADISGFTALSEKFDPEKVKEVINDTFSFITKPVYELEGTIDKYIGDCVMILFGAKYSHSDDASRALKCALDMMHKIEEYSLEKLSNDGITLNLSIGVNYGTVVTGEVGNYYDKDYTVIGDVVNTAQRLQVLADPGQILVSENIYMETKDFTHYLEPKTHRLKNKKQEELVYSPISISTNLIDDSSVLVSRENEMLRLADLYNSDSNNINVIGESGVGKTLFVKEFISHLESDVRRIWVNSNSVYKEKPFSNLASIISSVLTINDEDSSRIKVNRLRSFLDYLLVDLSEDEIVRNFNFLSLVLGLDRDDEYSIIINSMDYSDLYKEILSQTSMFFFYLNKKQSFTIILEDAHLSDDESMKILFSLSNNQRPIIFISQTQLPESNQASVIELPKFNKDETARLIQLDTGIKVDEEAINQIYDISQGNPMFIKELLRSVKRNNLLVENEGVYVLLPDIEDVLPKSIEGIILKKLEYLDKDALAFVRTASALGNEFNLSWMIDLVAYNETVLPALISENLIEFKSIVKSNKRDDKVYSFTQQSIQSAVYDNMLQKQKKEVHIKIAKYFESKLQKSYNHLESIGYHFELGKNTKKASTYYYKYADTLFEEFKYDLALEYYQKVISLESKDKLDLSYSSHVNKLKIYLFKAEFELAQYEADLADIKSESVEDKQEFGLLKAQLYKETTRFDDALKDISKLESIISKSSNLYGRLLQLKSAIYLMTGRPEVIELAKSSEELLTKSRDYTSLADTMSYAGIASFMSGDLENAIYYLNKGYDYAKLSNNLTAISKISTNLGIIYHASGEVTKSFTYLHSAIDAAVKVSSVKNYLSAAINLGVFYMEKGFFDRALPLFKESIDKSRNSKVIYQQCIATTNLADLLFELGNNEESFELYEESFNIATEYDLLNEQGINIIGQVKVLIDLNDLSKVEKLLEKANDIFIKTEEQANLADYNYYLALYSKIKGEEWIGYINSSIEFAKKSHNEVKELTALVLKATGVSNSMELLEEAKKIAIDIESNYELAKIVYEEYKINKNEEVLVELKQLMSGIDECKLSRSLETT